MKYTSYIGFTANVLEKIVTEYGIPPAPGLLHDI